MADRKDLIAAKKSMEEIKEHIGADSLGYLSVKGLMRAVGMPRDRFCHACFTGEYPIEVSKDLKVSKFALEGPNRNATPAITPDDPSPEALDPVPLETEMPASARFETTLV